MICKACKKTIDDDSLYCKYCGERQVKERKKKTEVSVPKPRQLKSGEWYAQLMIDGDRVLVKGRTEAEYYAKARALKSGLVQASKDRAGITLGAACRKYVASRDAVLSPSTIAGYENIIRNRFKGYMNKDIKKIDWQAAVNDEAKVCNAKTLKNAWGFLRSVLKANDVDPKSVSLPQLIPKELPWLTPEQIPIFLEAIKGETCEMAALFALHGLRKSEFVALTPSHIKDGKILVEGSRVRDSNNNLVYKSETKNISSRREVLIRIPRLNELLNSSNASADEFYIQGNSNNLHQDINAVCEKAGLPHVGCHGLRRSFASLAYSLGWSERETMREGGWADYKVMHKQYIKLAEVADQSADSMSEFYSNY